MDATAIAGSNIDDTSPVNILLGEASAEKKRASVKPLSRAPCDAPRLSVALARLVDLKAALLAEARARGPDGRAARAGAATGTCSRDQLRRRRGQHWRMRFARVVEAAGARPKSKL